MLNAEIVLKDAYRLLCVFMADKAIFDMTAKAQQVWGGSQRSDEPLFNLHQKFIEDEINHSLINLAICNRTHMEQMLNEHKFPFPPNVCGTLTKDVCEPATTDLSFRDACNKIIHADKFTATFLKDGKVTAFSGTPEQLHHVVRLQGKLSGKEWKADLDVLEFLRLTSNHFDPFF